MSSIVAALTNFGQSLAGIGVSSLYSVLAVFQAVFALAQNTVENILKLGQSITTLVMQLFEGVFGLIVGKPFPVTVPAHDSSFTSKFFCDFGHWWGVLLIHAQAAGKGTKDATEEEALSRRYICALPL
jgi:hypothetical protein